MLRSLLIVVLVSLTVAYSNGQSEPDTGRGLSPVRLAVVGGVTAGTVAAIHIYQQNAWWKGHRSSFHFREDLVYACNVDKLGHLYAASTLTFCFGKSLSWAGLSESSGLLWGAVGSSLFQTYVEIEDGFSEYWGFDRVDFAGDLVGAWYPYFQYRFPVLKNFQFRFSYLPKNAGEASAIPGQTKTILDDYEGQTIWLTVTPGGLLPDSWGGWWPRFLALALGVSVRNNVSPDRHLVWYIAPDLDMKHIIPQDTPFLRLLSEALNFIHFPMPAVQVAPGMVWYGLYF
jgi:hypothetical protein